ncbi:MAG: hypothetical protein Kow0099_02840 [Candidatus Abyssubacteria bacterium]
MTTTLPTTHMMSFTAKLLDTLNNLLTGFTVMAYWGGTGLYTITLWGVSKEG